MRNYMVYRIILSTVFFILSLSISGFYLCQVYKTWNADTHITEIYKYKINYPLDNVEGLKHSEIFSTENNFEDILTKLVKNESDLAISTANKSEKKYYYASDSEIPNSIDYFDPNFGTKILTFFVLFLVAGILVLPPIQISSPDKTDNTPTDRKTGAAPTTEKGPQPKPTDASQKTE